MAVTLFYLTGILMANVFVLRKAYFALLSMLICVFAVIRWKRRKSMLFFVLAWMLLLGNVRAAREQHTRDMPTLPGVKIEGRISRIEKPYRVYLSDVFVDGEASGYARDVLVTLMMEDDAPQPRVGQRVTGRGRLFAPNEKRNPGGINWRIQAICRGYELSGYLLPGWSVQGKAVFSLAECFRLCRMAICERITNLFGDQAPLFQGIMLGDKSAIDEELNAAMRLTGTAHILTVSGLHLSLIAGALGAAIRRLTRSRKSRFAMLSVFLLLFTGLTGAAAGTIRACIMAILRELARLRGRRYEPLTALSFAALCMTIVQPLWLLNASFQFSFFVVLSIQLFARAFSLFIARALKVSGRVRSLTDLFAVSLSAQLGSVPMQLMLYGYVPLLSLPMNLLCSMIMPALLLGGWLAAAVSLLSMELGTCLARGLSWISCVFERVSLCVASLRAAILRLPAPHGATVLLVFVLIFLLTGRIRFGSLRKRTALAVLLAVLTCYAVRFDPTPYYVQLDVGQGDSAIFRRGRRAVLVDVGPTDSYEALRYLRHEGLLVDAVILSHLDQDHAGALGVLLDSEIKVPAVIMAKDADEQEVTPEIHDMLAEIGRHGVALHEVSRGDQIDVNGILFTVLSPDDTLRGSNERSLLLHARVEDTAFLLTGDLPADCEPDWVPPVDILKVAHHGSKNSTTDTFADMASPELAIISVGADNGYGHPHARVLAALKDAQILRTDRDGCITVRLEEGMFECRRFVRLQNGQER